jgi:putative ABC transport system permease protein
MYKNYIKIAWRNILSNKLFSFINIFGLAIGIACCSIIYLYVNYEMSYDQYHENGDRIYRITTLLKDPKKQDHFAPSSPMMAVRIKSNFPEVSKYFRMNESKSMIAFGEKKIYDTKIKYADSTFFDFFSFKTIEGQSKNSLTNPYTIVLTQSTAKKYFGNQKAVGKIMQLGDTVNLTVTAVIADIPENTHFKSDAFISRSTLNELKKADTTWVRDHEENWFYCDSYSYILLNEHVDYKTLEPKINAMMDREMAEIRKQVGMSFNIKLQPIKDIHLRSNLDAEIKDSNNGDILYVYIFIGAALLILLIACCNFINLSTARSLNRSKEIGLRKVIGATRTQLIGQFLGESLVFSTIATVISILLVLIALPIFNNLLGTEIKMNLSLLFLYIILIVVIGFLAGLYPALLMSSFKPIQSLKGKISHGLSDIFFRKSLVIFQFTIAIVLIISTTLILQQLSFIQNRNIGMKKDQIVSIELKAADNQKSSVILDELKRNTNIINGSVNSFSFKGVSNITMLPEGFAENEMTSSAVFTVDENFIDTYEITMVEGRNFSKSFPSDAQDAFIVNEAAVKEFGWKTPKEALGKKIGWGGLKDGKVIGVMKDFNYASLHENIKPLVIHIFPQWSNNISLKLKTDNLMNTMAEIESTWKKLAPHSPFKYEFNEEEFNSLYQSEINMRSILSAFTFLSVLVACLGLFGLASFSIKQRFKEIGIRKVLGSSTTAIVQLIAKDFLKLVVISFVIAAPLAWYSMHKWLQDFAYKITISWWVFIIAGSIALIIAFSTVALQAIKAATANPVKSLRTE